MHKIAANPITLDCFEIGDYNQETFRTSGDNCGHAFIDETIIDVLENLRQEYLETKDKKYWKELIRWLPESWLQKRTWTGSYANLRNMRFQRDNHKLTEWHQMNKAIDELPYSKEFISYC